MTIRDMLEKWASVQPGAIALEYSENKEWKTRTYGEMLAGVREAAEGYGTRFGLVPEECLFIDDREKNLVGAKEVGMETILFTGYEPLVQELEQRGILR